MPSSPGSRATSRLVPGAPLFDERCQVAELVHAGIEERLPGRPRELHEALQAARIQQSLRERAAGVDDRRLVGEALGVIAAAAPAAEPPAPTGTAPAAPATEPAGESPVPPFTLRCGTQLGADGRSGDSAAEYGSARAGMRGIRPPWSDAAPQARAVPGGASASADSR